MEKNTSLEQRILQNALKASKESVIFSYLNEQAKIKKIEIDSEKSGITNGIQHILNSGNDTSQELRDWYAEIAFPTKEHSKLFETEATYQKIVYFSHFLAHRLIHKNERAEQFLLSRDQKSGKLIFDELEMRLNKLFTAFKLFPFGVNDPQTGYYFQL